MGLSLYQAVRWRVVRRLKPRRYRLRDFDSSGVVYSLHDDVERLRILRHGDETDYVTEMLRHLTGDDVFYDVGACLGLIALHAAHRCRTVAFEPDPHIRSRLKANLALNPDIDLEILPVAITDEDGPVTLYTDAAGATSPSLAHQRNEPHSVTVQGRTLDSLVRERGELPTVVKFDIEGAEILALRGGRELFGSLPRPRLVFLELHPSFLRGFNATGRDVLALLPGYESMWRRTRDDQEHLVLRDGRVSVPNPL